MPKSTAQGNQWLDGTGPRSARVRVTRSSNFVRRRSQSLFAYVGSVFAASHGPCFCGCVTPTPSRVIPHLIHRDASRQPLFFCADETISPRGVLSAGVGTAQVAGWIVEGRVVGASDGGTITVL